MLCIFWKIPFEIFKPLWHFCLFLNTFSSFVYSFRYIFPLMSQCATKLEPGWNEKSEQDNFHQSDTNFCHLSHNLTYNLSGIVHNFAFIVPDTHYWTFNLQFVYNSCSWSKFKIVLVIKLERKFYYFMVFEF